MNLDNNFEDSENFKTSEDYEDFDFSRFFQIIFLSRKFIALFVLISLILSSLYAFKKKPIWAGQFQIVMANDTGGIRLGQNLLSSFIGISSGSSENPIATQVKILESESVLLPIFEYVKKEKESQGINTKRFRFESWKRQLDVNLIRNTKILKIQYKDYDKSLILPVINLISKEYQNYAGKIFKEDASSTIKYLNSQVEKYKLKSAESLRESQIFASKNNLLTPLEFRRAASL